MTNTNELIREVVSEVQNRNYELIAIRRTSVHPEDVNKFVIAVKRGHKSYVVWRGHLDKNGVSFYYGDYIEDFQDTFYYGDYDEDFQDTLTDASLFAQTMERFATK